MVTLYLFTKIEVDNLDTYLGVILFYFHNDRGESFY